jgi:hypothetical protein
MNEFSAKIVSNCRMYFNDIHKDKRTWNFLRTCRIRFHSYIHSLLDVTSFRRTQNSFNKNTTIHFPDSNCQVKCHSHVASANAGEWRAAVARSRRWPRHQKTQKHNLFNKFSVVKQIKKGVTFFFRASCLLLPSRSTNHIKLRAFPFFSAFLQLSFDLLAEVNDV